MKTAIIIIVALVVLFGAYFIFSNNNSSQAPTNATPSNTSPVVDNSNVNANANAPAPTSASASVVVPPVKVIPSVVMATVNIKNFAFSPATLTVKVGTKVTWTNNDTVAHTVTSDAGSLLSSPTIAPGQVFSFTFNTVGTTNYHCSIHPMMKGQIVVTN